jgi:hypothetical protein
VEQARAEYEVSERRACRVVRQWRGTQRYLPSRRTDEDELTQAILALGVKYGRYGYRRITALLPLDRHDPLFLQVDSLSFHLVQISPVTSVGDFLLANVKAFEEMNGVLKLPKNLEKIVSPETFPISK